eukprot:1153644-Pelagomonas_calceolata.AAC.5
MLTIARARKSHKDAMPLQKKEKHTFKHRDAPLPYLAFHSPSSAQQFPMCFTCKVQSLQSFKHSWSAAGSR